MILALIDSIGETMPRRLDAIFLYFFVIVFFTIILLFFMLPLFYGLSA